MSSQLKVAVSDQDHTQGNSSAPLTLTEYGDYQCSYCGEAYSLVKEAQEALGDKLQFVFRNFPLSEAHPYATAAAQAAEAAGKQGKFWPMHDLLYENQEALTNEDLLAYAQEAGLDVVQFRTEFESDAVSQKVGSDFESGIRSGVNGTPSLFVNGEKYEGDWQDGALTAFLKGKL